MRYNYGGILQNFALQTVLRGMGHDVVTLDPQRYLYPKWKYPFVFLRHAVTRYIKGHREVPIFAEFFKDKLPRTLGKHTYPFIDKYIKRREYTDLRRDVKKNDFDAFIVGSDQVWRPEYNTNLPNMFLDFTKGLNVRRIAYAASFGTDTWSADEETTRKCRDGIRDFNLVTVREESGIKLCRQLFNIHAQPVLDPTLLLTKEDYFRIVRLDKVCKSTGNLLIYILDYTNDKRKLIDNIVKTYNLTPFRVNSDYEDRNAPVRQRIQPPVEKWIRGFYDADFVITDSFHACVFSIIFNKQFIVYGNEDRGMERFKTICNQLGLEDRITTNSGCYSKDRIDYSKINRRLENLRCDSLDILKEVLYER